MEVIQVEIGHELIQYVIETKNQPSFNLIYRIRQLRSELQIELNFELPRVRICDNSNLSSRQLRIYIYEKIVFDEHLSEWQGSEVLCNLLVEQIHLLAHGSLALTNQI